MLFAVVLAAPVFAQDMIAVGWSGSVYALDSYTGATNLLGYGAFGQNAVAHDDTGGLWSTSRGASGSVYSLTSLDPATGAASTAAANFSDVRAMESAGGTTLWAIVDGTPDELVTIDVLTSQVTVIGSTGYTGVQAIAALDGVLYGWDVNFGLLTIDPATGNATDVDPAVGGSGDVQWLARRSDGKLVGGHNGLYEIDPSTGGTTQIA
ncbi:MAG TPA: hypothetical protein ENI87_04675, partial [bacterium]|nr:hypothetical protein [bacterium]